MAEDRLIVWAHAKSGHIIDAFATVEEASAASGISVNMIKHCLAGHISVTAKNYTFYYEVKAGDLRRQKAKERREKWQKKLQ